ncbi:hypothetical protein PF005_g13679 [Phytophthora fragariae]|uniref:Uncharacterized protein n=1 Tax=Phytophthora fragariae TaxID=53985 RepID=A0A6A3XSM5_9STRA|nr:hypothetical protein PF003_g30813 [Phytophthora fragariae]KAE8933420.1 hypothetical protein PF009_g16571 [Phytophthora fragariae]KAE9004775.1 hypothetical protein PF011_g12311 [Phytophthora fragariae]KAE9094729.1 hypothetical protein PF007_g17661 [Phytophthora fragariae]KAE9101722.1 hypothetical protein PF010_g14356 [Phytophthora fragariae]
MLAGIALSAVALAGLATQTNAHGYLEQPKPSWLDSPNPGWVALVDNYWDIGSGGDQCGKFKAMAEQKGVSVKDVVLDMVKGQKCGNTLDSGAAQPIPSDGKVKRLGNGGGGFTHVGPCEIYLDDKMVLHGDNCQDEYKGGDVGSTQTSDMPVDYSACNGRCTLTFYWLAFQNAQWQAYVNCVPLSGSGVSATPMEGSISSTTQQQQSTPAPNQQQNQQENKEDNKGENQQNQDQQNQLNNDQQSQQDQQNKDQQNNDQQNLQNQDQQNHQNNNQQVNNQQNND